MNDTSILVTICMFVTAVVLYVLSTRKAKKKDDPIDYGDPHAPYQSSRAKVDNHSTNDSFDFDSTD
jgi:hypothetical protein